MTQVDVLVVGGGLGGVAAALGALRRGRRVLLTEEHAWLGGQLTSQGVPPDEHAWVEQFGVTAAYRALREGIREFYRRHYPLTETARRDRSLNPGSGTVSRLCAEPRVAVAVLEEMLAPYRSSGQLTVWQPWVPTAAETTDGVVRSVTLRHTSTGAQRTVSAGYVLDATELGDLLPLTGTDHVVGAEAADEHGEPSAPAVADPHNVQPITYCFAFDHVEGADHTTERPADYDYWREYQPDFWGDRLLSFTAPNPRTRVPEARTMVVNPAAPAADADQSVSAGDSDLWTFRRIVARANFVPGSYQSDVVLANWPMLDYLDASIIDAEDVGKHLAAARSLSLSYFHWLQTEAPRPDGGRGWPGLRMRGDLMGTDDGLAMAPYVRESRRIRALTTVTERDISVDVRGHGRPARFEDSVGVGMYRIDLHPSTGGDNYIDVPCAPFEIPLGALVPQRTTNLVAAAKNIGTTHITNGAYRLHPVEWNVGEAAGELAALCLDTGRTPREVATTPELLRQLQDRLVAAGVEIHWPEVLGY